MNDILLLVDGSTCLYRAFHARPELRSADGHPTGALHGMVDLLRQARHAHPAAYLACIFEEPSDGARPGPPAAPARMPDELKRQIGPTHDAVRLLGWPLLMAPEGASAHLIGALVAQARELGLGTVICSANRDLAQLVCDDVALVYGGGVDPLDAGAVEELFGVAPSSIVDYFTLIGDPVRNLPGVPRCGPKTARQWLKEHGSLDALIGQAHAIAGPAGEQLRAALAWLPRSRERITVRQAAPGEPGEPGPPIATALLAGPEDQAALAAFFGRYGGHALPDLTRPGANAAPPAAGPGPSAPSTAPRSPVRERFEIVTAAVDLQRWLALADAAAMTSCAAWAASDAPMTAPMVGIALAVDIDRGAYIPFGHPQAGAPQLERAAVIAALRGWLEDAAKPKVCHDLKRQLHLFANLGVSLRGVRDDTMLQSYVCEPHKAHDHDSLALRHMGHTARARGPSAGKGGGKGAFAALAADQAGVYAAECAAATLRLQRTLNVALARDRTLDFVYRAIEMPTCAVLQRMERTGVRLDVAQLEAQSHALGVRVAALEAQAYALADGQFNLASARQTADILFGKLGLPVGRKTAGGTPSTDEEVLRALAGEHALAAVLLEYRSLSKLKSTYTDKLPGMVNPATGRVHTNYAQAVAVTGRLASSDPNLQNIPVKSADGRRVRDAFVGDAGNALVAADYSQIELRIMAHLSGDVAMQEAFGRGEDIHLATAAELFGIAPAQVHADQRRFAKAVNFGLIYGMSAFGLATNLGVERPEAQRFIDRYFARFAGVRRYMDDAARQARAGGYVESVFGRRIYLPEIHSPNPQRRRDAERAAINAPMQGTAADLIKLAMVAVQDWLDQQGLDTKLLLQVHDELVLEVPPAELALVRQHLPTLMCGVARLDVPLIATLGCGRTWREAH